MKPASKFNYQLTRNGGQVRVAVLQPIDGPFEIPVPSVDGAETLSLDFAAVDGLNSEGTRQLTKWLWEVHVNTPAMSIRLERVTPAVARQLIAMKSYIDEAVETDSVYVPFFCDACDAEDRSTLVQAREVREFEGDLRNFVPAAPKCPTCGKPMELDVVPDKYFSLLLAPS